MSRHKPLLHLLESQVVHVHKESNEERTCVQHAAEYNLII